MGDAVVSLANKMGVDPDKVELAPRTFTSESRSRMADKGTALPDGSYPIPDLDALGRAIQAWGRCPPGKRGQLKSHLLKRARALGAGSDTMDRINNLEA